MQTRMYLGKVLPDGHLTLPKEVAKKVGQEFKVVLFPAARNSIYKFTEKLARDKEFERYTEDDIEQIIHESRGIRK